MNYTTNYQLSQWAKSDQVRMEDFNADNAKIDAAIRAVNQRVDGLSAAKADKTALNALAQTVNGKGNCRIVTGTYTGSGTYGSSNANRLDFADTLGKAPKLLIVRAVSGSGSALVLLRGMSITHYTLSSSTSGSCMVDVSWTGTGVSWYNSDGDWLQYNVKNTTYLYVAFG